MSLRISPMLLAALLCQSACAGKEEPAREAAPLPQTVAPPPVEKAKPEATALPPMAKPRPVEIKLISAGKPPLRQMRYSFSKKEEQVELITKVQVSARIDDRDISSNKLPDARLVIKLSPSDPSGAGPTKFGFETAVSEPIPTPGVDPKIMELMGTELSKSVGIQGALEIDARGAIEAAEPGVPDGGLSEKREMEDNIRSQLSDFTVQFPEEAIGVGAKWQIRTDLVHGPFVTFQEVEYALEKINGGRLTVKKQLKQHADPQPISPDGAASPATTFLDGYSATGSAELTVDLARLAPSGQIQLSSETRFAVTEQGQKHKVINRFATEITVRPK